MLLSKALEGFFLEMRSGNYAASTVELYQYTLHNLTKFLNDPQIEKITLSDLERFLIYLKTDYVPKRANKQTHPLKPACIDNHWKSTRTFFGWAHKVLGIARPDLEMPRPKYQSPEIIPFSQEEIKKMLAACAYSNEFKRENTKPYRLLLPNRLKDTAIILTLLDTGLRVGELCRLKVQDVDLTTGDVFVAPFSTGKKTRTRPVCLGKAARRAVWMYLAKKKDYKSEDSLFGLRPTPVRQFLRNIEKRSGVKDIHPHRFRHTFAIQYLKNGGDVFTLKRLLGHSTLEMCERYLSIVKEDVAAAHKSASPVDNWRL